MFRTLNLKSFAHALHFQVDERALDLRYDLIVRYKMTCAVLCMCSIWAQGVEAAFPTVVKILEKSVADGRQWEEMYATRSSNCLMPLRRLVGLSSCKSDLSPETFERLLRSSPLLYSKFGVLVGPDQTNPLVYCNMHARKNCCIRVLALIVCVADPAPFFRTVYEPALLHAQEQRHFPVAIIDVAISKPFTQENVSLISRPALQAPANGTADTASSAQASGHGKDAKESKDGKSNAQATPAIAPLFDVTVRVNAFFERLFSYTQREMQARFERDGLRALLRFAPTICSFPSLIRRVALPEEAAKCMIGAQECTHGKGGTLQIPCSVFDRVRTSLVLA